MWLSVPIYNSGKGMKYDWLPSGHCEHRALMNTAVCPRVFGAVGLGLHFASQMSCHVTIALLPKLKTGIKYARVTNGDASATVSPKDRAAQCPALAHQFMLEFWSYRILHSPKSLAIFTEEFDIQMITWLWGTLRIHREFMFEALGVQNIY